MFNPEILKESISLNRKIILSFYRGVKIFSRDEDKFIR